MLLQKKIAPLFPYMLNFIVHFVFFCSISVEVVDGFATCCSLHDFLFSFCLVVYKIQSLIRTFERFIQQRHGQWVVKIGVKAFDVSFKNFANVKRMSRFGVWRLLVMKQVFMHKMLVLLKPSINLMLCQLKKRRECWGN